MSRFPGIGRNARSAAVGALAAVVLTGGLGGLLTADAAVVTGARAVFVPISPCRLIDTRPASIVGPRAQPLQGGQPVLWNVRGPNGLCNIPVDATSVVMNMTVVNPTAAGFLTVWPPDEGQPTASSMNWVPGQAPTPNAVTAKLSGGGQIATFANAGTVDLIVDINGYYADHNHDDRYYTKSQIGALFLVESGDISVASGGFTSGTLTCPVGTLAVGTGWGIAGTFSFVKTFGTFVGYFLSNDHVIASNVSAQAICAQAPLPPPVPITAAGASVAAANQTSADGAAEWARALAQNEAAAIQEGLVRSSAQADVTTTRMLP